MYTTRQNYIQFFFPLNKNEFAMLPLIQAQEFFTLSSFLIFFFIHLILYYPFYNATLGRNLIIYNIIKYFI